MGCQQYGALLRVSTAMVDEWFLLSILRLVRDRKVYPVLALVAMARCREGGLGSVTRSRVVPV